ncbi:hypothetical protein JCM10207_006099 [Rhodosporidiobolus poonsookiae]
MPLTATEQPTRRPPDPHLAQQGHSTLSRARRTASSAGSQLAHLVKEEWDSMGKDNTQHTQSLPRPHLGLQNHTRHPKGTNGHPQQHWQPRKLPPPPKPVFPPSPPLSPEMAQEQVPDTEQLPNGKGKGKERESDEAAQLEAAIQASLREEAAKREPTDDDELEKALAESRALESVRLQRRSTVEQQEQDDLNAALLASERDKPPTPPEDTVRTLYRSRSATLPAFSADDLAPSHYPSEKGRNFPQGRPALPPGAAAPWDDEEREMQMLALAIRLSEEEEEERRKMDEQDEQAVLEQIRRAEAQTLQDRGMLPAGARSAESGSTVTATPSGATSTPYTSLSTAPSVASVSSTPLTSEPTSTDKSKKRNSWFRPPLSSKSSSPPSPPKSPPPARRPPLLQSATSATTVDTYRTAPDHQLPFSNLTRVVSAGEPSQSAPGRPSRPPPPAPTRLPPSPPETPQTRSGAFASPPLSAPPPLSGAAPSSPPLSAAEYDHFRRDNDGSPFEMPFISHSNSVRSSLPPSSSSRRGLGGAFDEYDRLGSGSTSSHRNSLVGAGGDPRTRTLSGGSTYPSVYSASGSREGEAASDDSHDSGADGSVLAVRNPDAARSISSTRSSRSGVSAHSEYSSDFSPSDEALWSLPAGGPEPGPGPYFESAYVGRSMSAIDEMTEPASSVVGTETGGMDGERRQGSFPSTLGTPSGIGEPTRMGSGSGAGEWLAGMSTSPGTAAAAAAYPFPTASPRPMVRPPNMGRSSSSSSSASATATVSQHAHPWPASSPNLALSSSAQLPLGLGGGGESRVSVASTAATSIPPAPSAISPPLAAGLTGGLLPPTSLASVSAGPGSAVSHDSVPPPSTPPLAPEDGLRFGYPATCAREPGHACPADGLAGAGSVPSVVELSSAPVGLGFSDTKVEGRKDAWAVEARSWAVLLRFLLWFGDTTIVASPADLAASPSRRCGATASLEFRPDDEGLPVVRLVVSLLPPTDPASHLPLHYELSVTRHSPPPASLGSNGKGKQRASAPLANPSAAGQATFSLPDALHLPARLSSLAIQLYTLRHLASIARATQPARSPPPPSAFSASGSSAEGYLALRALADSIGALARAAAERDGSSGGQTPRAGLASGSGGGRAGVASPPAEEHTQRLVDRLRDRLRRLRRHGEGAEPAAQQLHPVMTATTGDASKRASKLVKPAPPPRTQAVPRSERVLSAHAAQTIHSAASGGDLLEGLEERTAARVKGPLALALPSSSSCFHRALSSLPSSSSSSTSPTDPCAALTHSDAQRSALSAKMALCEIRTAAASGGKVPREFTVCSAFRRWADLELARDLHSSTSRTFSAFVDELREFEQARATQQAEDALAAQHAKTDLAALLASLSSLSTSLTSTHASHASSLHSYTSELQAVSAVLAQQSHTLERELASVVEKVKREVERAGGELALALRGSVEQHDASLTALSSRLDDRLALSLDAFSDRQAELTRSMLLLDFQPLSLSLALSLSGSLSSASQLETQLSALSTSHLAQASTLTAALANLTELVAAQQQGLVTGSTSWTGGLRLEDAVWAAQALWDEWKGFALFRRYAHLFALAGPAQAVVSSYGASWMPFMLLVLVMLGFPSAANLPAIIALLALAFRLAPALRLLLRLFHHLPKQRLYRRRARTVRFQLPPRLQPPCLALKGDVGVRNGLAEREGRRFMRAASAPL